MSEPVLCYVREPWAYFTTQALDKQWGDDWNDAPYEHNAGHPYGPYGDELLNKAWEIVVVAYDGPFETPCEGQLNSRWSVEQINAGAVAWLRSHRYSSAPPVVIPAGTTLDEFRRLIVRGGGRVYEAR